MTIALPGNPTGEQYEDLITALLKSHGYFTETHLTFREEKKEILELDAIATPAPLDPQNSKMVEVKTSSYSSGNLFKLYGQKEYLDIKEAYYICSSSPNTNEKEILEDKAEELDIKLCDVIINEDKQEVETDDSPIFENPHNDINNETRNDAISSLWYQQIGIRKALHKFKQKTKSEEGDDFEKARQYDLAVATSFFKPDSLSRAEDLYDPYIDFILNSDNLINELAEVQAERSEAEKYDILNEAKDQSSHYWLQYFMWLLHYSRISIIKNALEYNMYGASENTMTIEHKGEKIEIPKAHIIPSSFWEGVEKLKNHSYSQKLPYLFQIFIDLFGGFLLDNEEEKTLLQDVTGVPKDELKSGIKILDEFFRTGEDSSWTYTQSNEILCLKSTPAFVKGGGCFFRKTFYEIENYDEITSMDWLLGDWHNALYHLLEPTLGTQEE